MRRCLRSVVVLSCMVIIVSLMGCPTGRENRETSMPQAPASGEASATGKSMDGATSAPAGADASKQVSEPNELRNSSRPPIIYGREPDILPLSEAQVERVKKLVAEQQPGKEIWFIYVPLNKKMSSYDVDVYNYRVTVYCRPDQQSARVRRGVAVYAHLSGKVLPPRVGSSFYAQLCETDEGFSPNLAVPDDRARSPFTVMGDISDEDIIDVVRFIRSGPAVPVGTVHTSSGTERLFRRDPSLDPAAAIEIIHVQGEEISVEVTGPQPHVHPTYRCRKIDGIWTVVRVETFVS